MKFSYEEQISQIYDRYRDAVVGAAARLEKINNPDAEVLKSAIELQLIGRILQVEHQQILGELTALETIVKAYLPSVEEQAREREYVIEELDRTHGQCSGDDAFIIGIDHRAWLIHKRQASKKWACILPFSDWPEGQAIPSLGDHVNFLFSGGLLQASFKVGPKNARTDAEVAPAARVPAPAGVEAREKITTPENSLSGDPESAAENDSFGLLSLKPSEQKTGTAPAFFNTEDPAAPIVPNLKKEAKAVEAPPAPRAAASPLVLEQPPASAPTFRCGPLQDGLPPLKKRDGHPPEVYEPGELEHPDVPGLMLSLPERLYNTFLDIVNMKTGEVRLETFQEKRFRILWIKPYTPSPSMTSGDFVKIDMSLFPGPGGRKT